jgi:hypothetical protein
VPHPLVLQLRFTRSEFLRALEGVGDADSQRRFGPINSIGWNVGHLAWQEQRYWLQRAQGRVLLPDVAERFAYGAPASTPPLSEILASWRAITAEADPWLDTLTSAALVERRLFRIGDDEFTLSYGSMLQRVLYHYWYHTGENMAVRQLLGQRDLPDFVGNIDDEAPYTPEAGA